VVEPELVGHLNSHGSRSDCYGVKQSLLVIPGYPAAVGVLEPIHAGCVPAGALNGGVGVLASVRNAVVLYIQHSSVLVASVTTVSAIC
jgi:hypothetical protein